MPTFLVNRVGCVGMPSEDKILDKPTDVFLGLRYRPALDGYQRELSCRPLVKQAAGYSTRLGLLDLPKQCT